MDEMPEPDPVLCQAVGQVIYWTALLEARLQELAARLDWRAHQTRTAEELHDKYQGRHGRGLWEAVEQQAGEAGVGDEGFSRFLARAAEQQNERNALARSMFFDSPVLGSASGTTNPGPSQLLAISTIFTRGRLGLDARLAKQAATEAGEWLDQCEVPTFHRPPIGDPAV